VVDGEVVVRALRRTRRAGLEELGWAGRVGLGWRRRAGLEEEGGAGLGGSCWTRGFVLD
jgi:hypothetical protein